MDVWWNKHFLYKDLESSNWNNHLINGCLGFQGSLKFLTRVSTVFFLSFKVRMLSTLDGDGLLPCDLAKAAGVFGVPKTGGRRYWSERKPEHSFWRKRGWLFDISLLIGVYSAGLIEDAVILYFFQKNKTMDLFLTTTFGLGDFQSMMPWQISFVMFRRCGSCELCQVCHRPVFFGWKGRGFWEWPSHPVKRKYIAVEIKSWTESKACLVR